MSTWRYGGWHNSLHLTWRCMQGGRTCCTPYYYASHDEVCRVAEFATPHVTTPENTRYAGWQNLLHPMLLRLKWPGMQGGRTCCTPYDYASLDKVCTTKNFCCTPYYHASYDEVCRVAELAAHHVTTPHIMRHAWWQHLLNLRWICIYCEVCRVAELSSPHVMRPYCTNSTDNSKYTHTLFWYVRMHFETHHVLLLNDLTLLTPEAHTEYIHVLLTHAHAHDETHHVLPPYTPPPTPHLELHAQHIHAILTHTHSWRNTPRSPTLHTSSCSASWIAVRVFRIFAASCAVNAAFTTGALPPVAVVCTAAEYGSSEPVHQANH